MPKPPFSLLVTAYDVLPLQRRKLYPLELYNTVKLFGTSGIRGRYPEDVHESLFMKVGSALGSLFQEVVVGRDVRRTGRALQEALMAGLASAGTQVHDCGMVTTPTVAHVAAGFDCGCILTASHNPPEYNGLKLWSSSGMAFDEDLRSKVEEAMDASPSHSNWREVGRLYPYEGALREHKEKVLSAVESSDVKVVVDCGNGAASLLAPFVLGEMGCQLAAINCQPDGSFPARGAEPTEEALRTLKKAVLRSKYDIGIAYDGDGDRMVAVDEEGRVVKPEKLLILFARASGAKKVVAPVDASMILEDVLGRGSVIRTKVGDVFVAETIVEEEADLGGEPSGTWVFPDFALCPDGIYAAAYLCSILRRGTLGELVREIPEYPIIRDSLSYVPAKDVRGGLEGGIAAMDAQEVTRLDGWRLEFGDAWALVRPSGTEPKVRITVEAREEERAREIYARLHSKVSKAIS
ncbi:MAG: phosphoglucosamine mutase [Thermoplasmata archaeon]